MHRTSLLTPGAPQASIVSLCALVLLACSAGAQTDEGWLQRDDWRSWLQTQEFGGRSRDFRSESRPESDGPSHMRRRLTAGGLSLLLPGAGQLYNDQPGKAAIMIGAEVLIWGTYLGLHRHANALSEDYRNWAGIFAGTSGQHPDNYWQAVGRYMDSDAWDDALRRQARAFGEPYPPPPAEAEQWQWRSGEHRRQYQVLRADANVAYDRRNKVIMFVILNRAISVYDALRNGGRPSPDGTAGTSASLLGLDLTLEVAPAFRDPGARATVGWSF